MHELIESGLLAVVTILSVVLLLMGQNSGFHGDFSFSLIWKYFSPVWQKVTGRY